MKLRVVALVIPCVALFSLAAVVPACGDDDDGRSIHDAGVVGEAAAPVCAKEPDPVKPASSCDVTLGSPPIAGQTHVPEGTPIAYCSNPPSSGNHYPVWADFQEYSSPVEWPYLVHDLEHGAILLLYKCDPPGCPDVVEQFRQIRDAAPADPLCVPGTKRFIIAPNPTIPTKIAAVAWGKTYTATCVDVPTLTTFATDNYAKGPEDLCSPGRAF